MICAPPPFLYISDLLCVSLSLGFKLVNELSLSNGNSLSAGTVNSEDLLSVFPKCNCVH